MGTKEIFKELSDYSWHDKWGSAMGTYFDVATEAWGRGMYVEGFYAGAGVAIENEFNAETLKGLNNDELERLVKFCHRLTHKLEAAGLAY